MSSPSVVGATAGPETGDVLVRGVAVRDEKPVAGAQVWVALYPIDDDAAVGETVDVWTSESVSTDAEGAYAVAVDPDQLTSKYYDGDFLNFTINVSEQGDLATWNSTVWPVRGVWRSDERARVADPVLAIDFDLAAPSVVLTDSFGESEQSKLPLMEDVPTGAVP